MSVKSTKDITLKIVGKGLLTDITEDGFIITDEKERTEEILLFDTIRQLLGKPISITIQNKEESLQDQVVINEDEEE